MWQDGRVTHHRWWQPAAGDARDVPPPPPTFAEAAGRLCTLLEEVVGMWRMGDVPLGAFLSGGLDSTLVTAILARLARRNGDPVPSTFSVGYAPEEGAGADELDWASRAAAALGTRHREVRITGREVGAQLQQIAWHLDEPLGDPASVPLWFLTRRARQEVTIALSGEGADEVFGGYEAYRHALVAEKLRALPGAARLAGAAERWLPVGKLRRAARMVAVPLEQRYRGVARAFDDALRPDWGARGAAARALAPSWERAAGAPTALGRMMAFDQQVWLADDLLVKADKMTMAHSLELRPPFLDVRLMEEIAAWPDAWKHDGRVGKRILRAAARGVVPDAILDRPKLGFGTPTATWLRGALADQTRDLLLGPGSLACDREDGELIEKLLAEHATGAADRTSELWTLLALEAWRDAVIGHVHVVPSVDVHVVHTPAQPPAAPRSALMLLLDADGNHSPLAAAARRAGHRVVVAAGVEAAEIVLGSLIPDAILVRAQSPERDRVALARLEHIAPEVPVRVVDAGVPEAAVDEALPA